MDKGWVWLISKFLIWDGLGWVKQWSHYRVPYWTNLDTWMSWVGLGRVRLGYENWIHIHVSQYGAWSCSVCAVANADRLFRQWVARHVHLAAIFPSVSPFEFELLGEVGVLSAYYCQDFFPVASRIVWHVTDIFSVYPSLRYAGKRRCISGSAVKSIGVLGMWGNWPLNKTCCHWDPKTVHP